MDTNKTSKTSKPMKTNEPMKPIKLVNPFNPNRIPMKTNTTNGNSDETKGTNQNQ